MNDFLRNPHFRSYAGPTRAKKMSSGSKNKLRIDKTPILIGSKLFFEKADVYWEIQCLALRIVY